MPQSHKPKPLCNVHGPVLSKSPHPATPPTPTHTLTHPPLLSRPADRPRLHQVPQRAPRRGHHAHVGAHPHRLPAVRSEPQGRAPEAGGKARTVKRRTQSAAARVYVGGWHRAVPGPRCMVSDGGGPCGGPCRCSTGGAARGPTAWLCPSLAAPSRALLSRPGPWPGPCPPFVDFLRGTVELLRSISYCFKPRDELFSRPVVSPRL